MVDYEIGAGTRATVFGLSMESPIQYEKRFDEPYRIDEKKIIDNPNRFKIHNEMMRTVLELASSNRSLCFMEQVCGKFFVVLVPTWKLTELKGV